MMVQRTREETIASLLRHGMTEAEIVQLAADDAAAKARKQVQCQLTPLPIKPAKRRTPPPALPTPTPNPLAPPTTTDLRMTPAPPVKARFQITNWKAYNAALVQRGSLTIWLADDVLVAWRATARGGAGRPLLSSDAAIQCILTLQQVFHLRLRQTEGFVRSLMTLAHVDLPVPDYSTFSRRRQTLAVPLPRALPAEPLHVVIDSTGLKIFGEGEWKARQHGVSKRRTWRRIHLGSDAASQTILACVVTTNAVVDGDVLPDVLDAIPEPIQQVSADGAYDWASCYDAIRDRDARAVIPPRTDAVVNPDADWAVRNATVARVAEIGRAAWKQETGYHRRSLAETAMSRLKTMFGSALTSRTLTGQQTEAAIRCAALNRMTQLGLPHAVAVPTA